MLHGFPEFWWTWRHQLAALPAAGFRAVAVDLRGYGGSDKPPRGYDLVTAAADAAGLVRAMGEANAIVIGHGLGLRVENRTPGGDVNPYLALAAAIAAGLHGIEQELPLEEPMGGNAYLSDAPRVPGTLRDAAELFEQSALARAAFGDDVVDHYTHMARVEVAAYDAAVTDWERYRGFERL